MESNDDKSIEANVDAEIFRLLDRRGCIIRFTCVVLGAGRSPRYRRQSSNPAVAHAGDPTREFVRANSWVRASYLVANPQRYEGKSAKALMQC